MVKNDKKRPEKPSQHFFWKNGFRHFFFDKIICLSARDKKNLMNSYGEKPGRTHARTHAQRRIYRTNLRSRWVQK